MRITTDGQPGQPATDGPGIEVGERFLTLHVPPSRLPAPDASILNGWLEAHGIDPDRLALDVPIERDELSASLKWRERTADGVILHHRLPAVSGDDTWPAPFPDFAAATVRPAAA